MVTPDSPGQLPVRLTVGDSWSRALTFTSNGAPLDLTSWTALAQVRVTPTDPTVAATMTVTLGGAAGTVTLSLAAGSLTVGGYVWDLQLTDAAGGIGTWLSGSVSVMQDVSRP